MTKIQELMDKLRSEYQTELIVADLGKKGNLNTFSEESERTNQKLGSIELFELREISKTTQCQACLEYSLG